MDKLFRADHIGSFLRPAELMEARSAGAAPDHLREIEDSHIARVLYVQRELGMKVFTDGELRRTSFMSDFFDAVDGLDRGQVTNRTWRDGVAPASPMKIGGIATGTLRQTRWLTDHEIPFLIQHSPGPIKITLPSPTQFPAIMWKKGISDHAYPTHTPSKPLASANSSSSRKRL